MKEKNLSPRSGTYDYIYGLAAHETEADYVVKIACARELISRLPSPSNVQRNLESVPDIQIRLLLSTSKNLPRYITRQIEQSENKGYFTHKNLLGLCTSGRGLPVEIFLHDHVMMEFDPSGEIFEEVAWHEIVHGIEGIEHDAGGVVKRHMPWSYVLQQTMLDIDAQNGHVPDLPDDPKASAYINYLRSGTSLQDNVSEIFARVAVIFMYHIKETGMALTSMDDFLSLTSEFEVARNSSRKHSNISDFMHSWLTFSDESRQLFVRDLDTVIKNSAKLYGCDVDD